MSMQPKIPDRAPMTALLFSSPNVNVLLAIRSSRAGNLLTFTVDYTSSGWKYLRMPQVCISRAGGAWVKLSDSEHYQQFVVVFDGSERASTVLSTAIALKVDTGWKPNKI